MVGVSFKPATDDLRESPLAALAKRLIDAGYGIRIYDPFVKSAFDDRMAGAGRGNDKVENLAEKLVGNISDLIALSDIIVVGHRYEEAVAPLSAILGQKPMVDLTRVEAGRVSGPAYEGICW